MALFDRRFREIHHALSASFWNVKGDIQTISSWVEFLNQRLQEQEAVIDEQRRMLGEFRLQMGQDMADVKAQLRWMPKSREEIKEIVDLHYSMEVVGKVRDLSERLLTLEARSPNDGLKSQILALKERLEGLQKPQKVNFKEKLLKKISQNSKDYIKGIILGLIRKYEKIGALQLREMVVEEQGLCSKSSFYRLLEEIEEMDEIEILQKGKQNFYAAKTVTKHAAMK